MQLVETTDAGAGLTWQIGDIWPEKALEDVINCVVGFCDDHYDREDTPQ